MAIWLNEAEVRALLPLGDLIDCMATALTAFSSGQVRQPVRQVIEPGAGGNFFAAMPVWMDAGSAMGAKLVTVYHQNGSRGLPTHQAVIVLLDGETGALLAVMDGRYITEARTAAVSALALRHLARRDAQSLAIVGSGVQAGSHLRAFALVTEFSRVRCWSPTAEHLRKFIEDNSGVQAAGSAEAAVRGADVVLLVSSATTPVVWSEWIAPGACVISVGACRPTQREMDPRLVARGRVIVDSRAAALKEAGDLVLAMGEGHFDAGHIAGELGDVLAGRVTGRTSGNEITIFKPLGQAVEDVAAAQLVYARALASGRGVALA
jgi:ornithine cyclodeaminase/alanine dehydrogenase-like protein (mu-crystallin family)